MTTPTDNKLAEALREAATRFRMYQRIHEEKATPDGMAKAQRNATFAEECEEALREHEAAKARADGALPEAICYRWTMNDGSIVYTENVEPPLITANDEEQDWATASALYDADQMREYAAKNTQEEGSPSKDTPKPVSSAGLPDRLDSPSVEANGLSDEVVQTAVDAYDEAHRAPLPGESMQDVMDVKMRAALAAAYPAMVRLLSQAEQCAVAEAEQVNKLTAERNDLRTKLEQAERLAEQRWKHRKEASDNANQLAANVMELEDRLQLVQADNERLRADAANDRPPIELNLATKDVAVCWKGRFEGWVFVRHVDGVNWTSAAQLTEATYSMFKLNMQRRAALEAVAIAAAEEKGA
jgi:hypothetical protein